MKKKINKKTYSGVADFSPRSYILAEMASSHEGKLKIAQFIIKSAAKAKADGILFQLMNLDTYIVPDDEDYPDTKSFYLNQKGWAKLIEIANNLGLDLWANVYDLESCLLYTSPSPRDGLLSRMPSSA